MSSFCGNLDPAEKDSVYKWRHCDVITIGRFEHDKHKKYLFCLLDRESLLSLTETLQTLIKYTLNFFWTAELSVDKIYFKSLAESLIYKSHLSQFLTARAKMNSPDL